MIGEYMESTTHRYEYEVPEGKVFVVIHAAEIGDVTDQASGEYREVFRHRVEISTDPTSEWDRTHEYLTIRGRRYRIHTYHKRVPDRAAWVDWHGRTIKWSQESDPYRGGFRNDTQGEVGRQTRAYARLGEIEREVLELFEADQPEWRRRSERMALDAERHRWDRKADEARKALCAAEENVAAFVQRIAAY